MSQEDAKTNQSDVQISQKTEPNLPFGDTENPDPDHTPNVKDDNKHDVLPQNVTNSSCVCGQKGTDTPIKSFIYAIGRIEPRFPSLGVEKEYYQALGRTETKGQTDFESMQKALSPKEYRYLVRKMCWVLKVEGIETYLLIPRDSIDLDILIETIRAPPRGTDVDVVIGVRGPIASPDMCNGLMIPIVIFDQIYSFDVDSLIKSIPKPARTDSKKFLSTAEELFNRVIQLADNVGSTDEHRALNYLSVRYDAIYANASEMHERDFSLSAVEVRPSRLSSTRKIVDVILSYRNRKSDFSERYFVRVDVTEEFPFLVSKLSPYYSR